MAAGFDIAGHLTVAVEGLGARDREPLTDIQRNAGDARVTATDGARFYVLAGGARCAVPPPART